MSQILRLENISKTYQAKNGETEALKNINFTVNEGEFIGIIGPSGCGKSTLLSIIAGLEDKSGRKNLYRWRRSRKFIFENWLYVTKRQLIRMENYL